MCKNIIVGLTGSIASVKGVSLCLALRHVGFNVRVAMTRSAAQFITPLALSGVTEEEPYTDLWLSQKKGGELHINWSDWADAIVIAPATASCISDLSYGKYDNPVTLLAANLTCENWYLAPAMAETMWLQPAVQENVNRLKSWGAHILEPPVGKVASGQSGRRLMEPSEIAKTILQKLGKETCA